MACVDDCTRGLDALLLDQDEEWGDKVASVLALVVQHCPEVSSSQTHLCSLLCASSAVRTALLRCKGHCCVVLQQPYTQQPSTWEGLTGGNTKYGSTKQYVDPTHQALQHAVAAFLAWLPQHAGLVEQLSVRIYSNLNFPEGSVEAQAAAAVAAAIQQHRAAPPAVQPAAEPTAEPAVAAEPAEAPAACDAVPPRLQAHPTAAAADSLHSSSSSSPPLQLLGYAGCMAPSILSVLPERLIELRLRQGPRHLDAQLSTALQRLTQLRLLQVSCHRMFEQSACGALSQHQHLATVELSATPGAVGLLPGSIRALQLVVFGPHWPGHDQKALETKGILPPGGLSSQLYDISHLKELQDLKVEVMSGPPKYPAASASGDLPGLQAFEGIAVDVPPNLTRLALSGRVRQLQALEGCDALQELQLLQDCVSPVAIAQLLSCMPALTHLELDGFRDPPGSPDNPYGRFGKHMRRRDLQQLADAVGSVSLLESLSVTGYGLQGYNPRSCKSVVSQVMCQDGRVLHVSGLLDGGPESATGWGQALQGLQHLKHLTLHTNLTESEVQLLAGLTGLSTLDLAPSRDWPVAACPCMECIQRARDLGGPS